MKKKTGELFYSHTCTRCAFSMFLLHIEPSCLCTKLEQNNIKFRFVPASCTGELQPLDLSGNDEFKTKVQESFVTRYSDEINQEMNLGKSMKDIKI